MTLYHEIPGDTRESILRDGLKRTSRGDKGDDAAIQQADKYLDDRRPAALRENNVSRDDNIYAYLGDDRSLVDIRSGDVVPLNRHPDPDSSLLRLSVDPALCYVSDLDRYDALKQALEAGSADDLLEAQAAAYWDALIPLASYQSGSIRRPEVMITRDIAPEDITVVEQ